ncbi:hypothetical protein MAPG_09328 [Magnaporthiopsis poae ATCC 64411]|uniref:Uncharacterized protein n=1 Tax=Magnaporthiopsis poae (strain ATCC 64411 / 73-15) TaxID=644358 RepID=A0A0C4E9N2_MAGP6|nr:hypothetical protein MAPG_09328 [Magnaporthiopsis poae ATCC 64411]
MARDYPVEGSGRQWVDARGSRIVRRGYDVYGWASQAAWLWTDVPLSPWEKENQEHLATTRRHIVLSSVRAVICRAIGRCLVPGARCPVPGAQCPLPGAQCPVPGAWCLGRAKAGASKASQTDSHHLPRQCCAVFAVAAGSGDWTRAG